MKMILLNFSSLSKSLTSCKNTFIIIKFSPCSNLNSITSFTAIASFALAICVIVSCLLPPFNNSRKLKCHMALHSTSEAKAFNFSLSTFSSCWSSSYVSIKSSSNGLVHSVRTIVSFFQSLFFVLPSSKSFTFLHGMFLSLQFLLNYQGYLIILYHWMKIKNIKLILNGLTQTIHIHRNKL